MLLLLQLSRSARQPYHRPRVYYFLHNIHFPIIVLNKYTTVCNLRVHNIRITILHMYESVLYFYTGWFAEHAQPVFSFNTEFIQIVIFFIRKIEYLKTCIFSNYWDSSLSTYSRSFVWWIVIHTLHGFANENTTFIQ